MKFQPKLPIGAKSLSKHRLELEAYVFWGLLVTVAVTIVLKSVKKLQEQLIFHVCVCMFLLLM